MKWWRNTYPDGEVEGQPNTSEISGRERQPFLRQEVFGCRAGSAVSNNGIRVRADVGCMSGRQATATGSTTRVEGDVGVSNSLTIVRGLL